MAKYIVTVKEHCYTEYEIEANNECDAVERVMTGKGEITITEHYNPEVSSVKKGG